MPVEKNMEQIEIAERIVRLETKLDFLISQIDRLPPSPACIEQHEAISNRVTVLEAWRNRAVGVLLVINIVLVATMDKVLNFFGTK